MKQIQLSDLPAVSPFPEWQVLQKLLYQYRHLNFEFMEYGQSALDKQQCSLPLWGFKLAGEAATKNSPTLALVAGVHGNEMIGVHTLIALLESLFTRLTWDTSLQLSLSKMHLVVVPFYNPMGIKLGQRANAQGVDLMRNNPTATSRPALKILNPYQGQSLNAQLPWYQGSWSQPEPENQAFYQLFQHWMLPAQILISLDFHSGFGWQDQLWFPYAGKTHPFKNLASLFQFFKLFESSYPNHFYKIEPTGLNYHIHGDLWDYLYDQYRENTLDSVPKVYLPLTLEMGSWLWVKKSPSQIFSKNGFFNPLPNHRRKRVLRRHLTFFDFIIRALSNSEAWLDLNNPAPTTAWNQALERWYQ